MRRARPSAEAERPRQALAPRPAPRVPPPGVSAAFLLGFLVEQGPPGTQPERRSTRSVAAALRRRLHEAGESRPHTEELAGSAHFVTGGALAGDANVYVAHAWDGSFPDLVACIAADSGGNLDRRYAIDVFTTDLQASAEDPVAAVQSLVAGAREVLLVIDSEARALGRSWVLFEALLAAAAGKLRVRCSSPEGFGASLEALNLWEARIDAVDWLLAQATRRADEKRLRSFAERTWGSGGEGTEQRLAHLKKFLRREIYGEVLLGAVARGDACAVEAALDHGASPDQQDGYGNTAEELAAFDGREDIEELIFQRRMRGLSHQRLSAFFSPLELAAAAELAEPDVLAPFLTEAAGDLALAEEAKPAA